MKPRRAKRVRPSVGRARHVGGPADGVVEEAAAGRQQLEALLEVHGELRQADVLEHADRADRVVGPVVDVAVVLVPDLDLVGQPGLGDPLLGQLGLALRERDADRFAHRGARRRAAACRPSRSRCRAGACRARAPSLRQISSCLFACASSSVCDGSVHTAHEYVIEGPSTSR